MRLFKHSVIPRTGKVDLAGGGSAGASTSRNDGPDIRLVITDYYSGGVNNVIYMIIRKAEKVMVSIFSVEGNTVEFGEASCSSSVWSYRTTIPNPDFPEAKVVILATDNLGNQTELILTVL